MAPRPPRTALTDVQIAERYGDMLAVAIPAMSADMDTLERIALDASDLVNGIRKTHRGRRKVLDDDDDRQPRPWTALLRAAVEADDALADPTAD